MAKATYRAPAGDSELVRMRGVRFVDGEATELDPAEHRDLIKKLRGNPHFDVDGDDGSTFRAVHRGRGVYGVIAGETPVETDPMTKEDAEAFNALSDEDRAALVGAASAVAETPIDPETVYDSQQ